MTLTRTHVPQLWGWTPGNGSRYELAMVPAVGGGWIIWRNRTMGAWATKDTMFDEVVSPVDRLGLREGVKMIKSMWEATGAPGLAELYELDGETVVLTRIAAHPDLGMAQDPHLLIWTSGPPYNGGHQAVVFGGLHLLHWTYLAEKLPHWEMGQLRKLLKLIEAFTDVAVGMPPETP